MWWNVWAIRRLLCWYRGIYDQTCEVDFVLGSVFHACGDYYGVARGDSCGPPAGLRGDAVRCACGRLLAIRGAEACSIIEVKVDEQLAAAIADKAVKQWHATSFSNGKKRVYVTFEEVRTVSA